jgi:polyisoprenoid-binding protein YceI
MSTSTWSIDPVHSGVHFHVRHLIVAKVHGQFRRWSGELAIDEADLTRSSVSVTIHPASIDTGNANRDADLRSANFFDADRFPLVTFVSSRVERVGDEAYRVYGDLTIRDVTRKVVLDTVHGGFVTDPWGGRRTGFGARTSILRSDFGIVWNEILEAGGVALGDRVEIGIEIEAVAQAAETGAA